ncbi:HNH endonuclease [Candidatus Peregrinibacteria bacterium]|nr:HNH endonuclease [Candidatus Peregrinibacteria bacterium]
MENAETVKCSSCELETWQGKEIVLEIDHIDGNSDNNSLDNLRLLCPNCHSQTKTYKNRNKGNGRQQRRKACVA